jgi:hypothetical protein
MILDPSTAVKLHPVTKGKISSVFFVLCLRTRIWWYTNVKQSGWEWVCLRRCIAAQGRSYMWAASSASPGNASRGSRQ